MYIAHHLLMVLITLNQLVSLSGLSCQQKYRCDTKEKLAETDHMNIKRFVSLNSMVHMILEDKIVYFDFPDLQGRCDK